MKSNFFKTGKQEIIEMKSIDMETSNMCIMYMMNTLLTEQESLDMKDLNKEILVVHNIAKSACESERNIAHQLEKIL